MPSLGKKLAVLIDKALVRNPKDRSLDAENRLNHSQNDRN